MPMLRVVIVPGTGQCPVRECCWYSWIAQELSASGVQVLLPEPAMPDPFESREQFWLPYITDVLKVDSNTVLIGHSTGGDAVLRLLETTEALGAIIIAAGPSPQDLELSKQGRPGMGYYDRPWQWDAIKDNCTFLVQLHHLNDPGIDVSVAREIAHHLTGPHCEYFELTFDTPQLVMLSDTGEYHRINVDGLSAHFMQTEFPALLEIISARVPSVNIGSGR